MILFLGDLVVFGIVIYLGFIRHESVGSLPLRFPALFVPFAAAWSLIAFSLGVYAPDMAVRWKEFWRPVLALLYAVPMAAVLRGVLLNSPVLPVFVFVIIAFSLLGLVIWRAGYLIVADWLQKK